jgi:hypothetical protein
MSTFGTLIDGRPEISRSGAGFSRCQRVLAELPCFHAAATTGALQVPVPAGYPFWYRGVCASPLRRAHLLHGVVHSF